MRACTLRCWRGGIFGGGFGVGKYCHKSQRDRKNQRERSGREQKKIHASAMLRHATTGRCIVFFGNGFGRAKILYSCDEGVLVTQAENIYARAIFQIARITLAYMGAVQGSQNARTPIYRP